MAKSEPDYASIRAGMTVQAGRRYMPFFGLCRARAFCVDQPSSKTFLWLLLPGISRYNHTNSTMPHKMFICFGHGDGRQLNRCFAVVANAVAWGVACQGERKQRRSITEEQAISVRVTHQCTNRSIYITRAYRTFIHSHSIP